MAVLVNKASYFEEASKLYGATPENIRAAERMVDLMLEGRSDLVKVQEIDQTRNTEGYRTWHRITGLKFTVRTIIEYWQDERSSDVMVLIHAVIPRTAHTYHDAEDLWKQHRQKAE